MAQQSYEQEFAEFMAANSDTLANAAWLLTGNQDQAEELVQEALTRTFVHWRKARRDPLAYARKMLASRQLAAKRTRQREPAVPQVPDQPVQSQEAAVVDNDRLNRALGTLSERQRQIVVLRHLMGLSEQEVANDLGVSLGTVKSTASRGLAQLRAVLEAEDNIDEYEEGNMTHTTDTEFVAQLRAMATAHPAIAVPESSQIVAAGRTRVAKRRSAFAGAFGIALLAGAGLSTMPQLGLVSHPAPAAVMAVDAPVVPLDSRMATVDFVPVEAAPSNVNLTPLTTGLGLAGATALGAAAGWAANTRKLQPAPAPIESQR